MMAHLTTLLILSLMFAISAKAERYAVTAQRPSDSNYTVTMNHFETYDESLTAFNAERTGAGYVSWGGGGVFHDSNPDTAATLIGTAANYGCVGWWSSLNNGYGNIHFYVNVLQASYWAENIAQYIDSDGDGIPDLQDPFPDDATPFTYRITQYQEDEYGNLTWFRAETATGLWFEMGEHDDTETDWVVITPEKIWNHDSSELAQYSGNETTVEELEGEPAISDYSVTIDKDPITNETLQTGDTGDSSGTEIQELAKIVDNTKKGLDNQQTISDQITETNDLLRQLKNMEAQRSVIESSTDETSGGTGEENETVELEDSDETTTEGGNAVSSIEGTSTDYDNDITELMPEEEDLTAEMEDITSDHTDQVTGLLEGSGVTLQDQVCEISYTWNWGTQTKQSSLSMCQYQTQLQGFGVVLLSITSIISIMLIFRR